VSFSICRCGGFATTFGLGVKKPTFWVGVGVGFGLTIQVGFWGIFRACILN